MALSSSLVTNEIKNAAGTEVEFLQQQEVGRTRIFAQVAEPPNLLHRLTLSHQETGEGTERIRRSVHRVDKEVTGVSGTKRKISFYTVGVIPVGDIANFDEVKNVCAENMSFHASTGADTTIKYDCSGNGASALVNGTIS